MVLVRKECRNRDLLGKQPEMVLVILLKGYSYMYCHPPEQPTGDGFNACHGGTSRAGLCGLVRVLGPTAPRGASYA
jgi:hypothetical protein